MELTGFLQDARRTQIGDLCSLQNGRAFKPTEWSNSGTPIIRIQNLNDPHKPYNYYSGDLPERFRVHNGDVLLSWSGTPGTSFGCFRWTGVDGWLNQHIFNVRLNTSRVLPDFFVVHVNAILDELIGKAHGGVGLRHITKGQLDRIELRIPELDRQREILEIISRAQNIVRMRVEAEQKVKEILPSVFLDMFGDPATNPNGWPVRRIGDVIHSAQYGTSTKASTGGAGLPMIRMGNVDFSGRMTLDDLKFVVLPPEDDVKYQLLAGDILFNRTNSKDLVGKTGIWRDERDAVAASYFIRVRVDESKVAPDYLWTFMNSRHMKMVLFGTARGAIGQSNINAQELRALRVPLPPIGRQRQFAQFVVQSLTLENQQSVATLQANQVLQSLLAGVFG